MIRVKQALLGALSEALAELAPGEAPAAAFENPKQAAHGDLAITAAMLGQVAASAAGPGLRLVGGGVAVAISAMGCHVLQAATHIDTPYLHGLVFAVAAIFVVEPAVGDTPGTARRFAALGCAHQDRRKRASQPGYADWIAATPFLPFAGPGALRGVRELSPLVVAIGFGLTIALRLLHAPLFR